MEAQLRRAAQLPAGTSAASGGSNTNSNIHVPEELNQQSSSSAAGANNINAGEATTSSSSQSNFAHKSGTPPRRSASRSRKRKSSREIQLLEDASAGSRSMRGLAEEERRSTSLLPAKKKKKRREESTASPPQGDSCSATPSASKAGETPKEKILGDHNLRPQQQQQQAQQNTSGALQKTRLPALLSQKLQKARQLLQKASSVREKHGKKTPSQGKKSAEISSLQHFGNWSNVSEADLQAFFLTAAQPARVNTFLPVMHNVHNTSGTTTGTRILQSQKRKFSDSTKNFPTCPRVVAGSTAGAKHAEGLTAWLAQPRGTGEPIGAALEAANKSVETIQRDARGGNYYSKENHASEGGSSVVPPSSEDTTLLRVTEALAEEIRRDADFPADNFPGGGDSSSVNNNLNLSVNVLQAETVRVLRGWPGSGLGESVAVSRGEFVKAMMGATGNLGGAGASNSSSSSSSATISKKNAASSASSKKNASSSSSERSSDEEKIFDLAFRRCLSIQRRNLLARKDSKGTLLNVGTPAPSRDEEEVAQNNNCDSLESAVERRRMGRLPLWDSERPGGFVSALVEALFRGGGGGGDIINDETSIKCSVEKKKDEDEGTCGSPAKKKRKKNATSKKDGDFSSVNDQHDRLTSCASRSCTSSANDDNLTKYCSSKGYKNYIPRELYSSSSRHTEEVLRELEDFQRLLRSNRETSSSQGAKPNSNPKPNPNSSCTKTSPSASTSAQFQLCGRVFESRAAYIGHVLLVLLEDCAVGTAVPGSRQRDLFEYELSYEKGAAALEKGAASLEKGAAEKVSRKGLAPGDQQLREFTPRVVNKWPLDSLDAAATKVIAHVLCGDGSGCAEQLREVYERWEEVLILRRGGFGGGSSSAAGSSTATTNSLSVTSGSYQSHDDDDNDAKYTVGGPSKAQEAARVTLAAEPRISTVCDTFCAEEDLLWARAARHLVEVLLTCSTAEKNEAEASTSAEAPPRGKENLQKKQKEKTSKTSQTKTSQEKCPEDSNSTSVVLRLLFLALCELGALPPRTSSHLNALPPQSSTSTTSKFNNGTTSADISADVVEQSGENFRAARRRSTARAPWWSSYAALVALGAGEAVDLRGRANGSAEKNEKSEKRGLVAEKSEKCSSEELLGDEDHLLGGTTSCPVNNNFPGEWTKLFASKAKPWSSKGNSPPEREFEANNGNYLVDRGAVARMVAGIMSAATASPSQMLCAPSPSSNIVSSMEAENDLAKFFDCRPAFFGALRDIVKRRKMPARLHVRLHEKVRRWLQLSFVVRLWETSETESSSSKADGIINSSSSVGGGGGGKGKDIKDTIVNSSSSSSESPKSPNKSQTKTRSFGPNAAARSAVDLGAGYVLTRRRPELTPGQDSAFGEGRCGHADLRAVVERDDLFLRKGEREKLLNYLGWAGITGNLEEAVYAW